MLEHLFLFSFKICLSLPCNHTFDYTLLTLCQAIARNHLLSLHEYLSLVFLHNVLDIYQYNLFYLIP
jgi:hypothetical protein